MSDPRSTVRAIDVGYGHVKFTDGRDAQSNAIRTDSFASQSTAVPEFVIDSEVMQRRDTFVVPVNARRYEVGKGLGLALGVNQETAILDDDFPLSDAYAARLYGALNYMARTLPGRVIDHLVLGLPLTTYFRHQAAVAKRFSGEHTINVRGDRINVNQCHVYPQPLGGYAEYLAGAPVPADKEAPMALVIDPGYYTVDWFVCRGMIASEIRSGAVHCGVSAILRAVAGQIVDEACVGAGVTETIRRIDHSLIQKNAFTMCGRVVALDKFMAAGDIVIDEAAQAVKNSIGSGADIDVLVLTGGGASLYQPAIARKFPHHEVVVLPDPAHANVRGFHLLGERISLSAGRAIRQGAGRASA